MLSTILAITGIILGAFSLAWQVFSHRAEGPRIRVSLTEGRLVGGGMNGRTAYCFVKVVNRGRMECTISHTMLELYRPWRRELRKPWRCTEGVLSLRKPWKQVKTFLFCPVMVAPSPQPNHRLAPNSSASYSYLRSEVDDDLADKGWRRAKLRGVAVMADDRIARSSRRIAIVVRSR